MRGLDLFVACTAGMGAGLVLDTRHVDPDALASLCSSAVDFGARLRSHWRLMPATHVSMVAVAFVAMVAHFVLPSRRTLPQRAVWCLRESLCVVAMSLGMAYAMDYASLVSTHADLAPFAAMVASMLAGMAFGVAGASLVLRAAWHGTHLFGAMASSKSTPPRASPRRRRAMTASSWRRAAPW